MRRRLAATRPWVAWWGCRGGNGPRGTKRATSYSKRDRAGAVETWTASRRDRERKKKGNIAAAAAAAVAVSAPLRVTLEGAHRRTVAQTTGAPVALKHVTVSIFLLRFVSTWSLDFSGFFGNKRRNIKKKIVEKEKLLEKCDSKRIDTFVSIRVLLKF